jgi:tryptophan-rich sensory protein
MRSIIALVVCVVAVAVAAGLGSVFTSASSGEWYARLQKPAWTPPAWLFGPVWTCLYLMMALAVWLVWRQAGLSTARLPLALFAVQLVLNAAWSPLFFGLKMPGLAFAEIVALLILILATLAAFWVKSRPAGLLMLPYLVWVAYASALNFAIWRLNS